MSQESARGSGRIVSVCRAAGFHFMKRLMLVGTVLLNIPGLAQAADMPLKAPLAPPLPAFTWTGIYGGGYIGGLWAKTDNDFVFPPPASWQQSASVGVAGGIVGLQYQWGSLVFGAEANVGQILSHNLGTASCSPPSSCFPGTAITATSSDALFSAGGRVGWALGYWLPYVSGGYASGPTFSQTISSLATTEIGRTSPGGAYIGGGLDWAVWGGLVVGLEYRHYDFRTQRVEPVNPFGGGVLIDTYNTTTKFDTLTFRATYLFNPN
jgi:outer membrane immunogenic protein